MPAVEFNCDGLPGPTHNHGGQAFGNLASMRHHKQISHPRRAALQSLEKMYALHKFGVPQLVLPPHDRPHLGVLRQAGLDGGDSEVVEQAWRTAPRLLIAAYSAAAMWVANAATVSPSADSADGKVHLTPANLVSNLHRAIEADFTVATFKRLFAAPSHFVHHDPLPAQGDFGDEGAANHSRLCAEYGRAGVQLFVFGREAQSDTRFPARQTRLASETIVRHHRLDSARVVLARQHPDAINAGAFHNDVVCVGDRNLLLLHAQAFVDQQQVLNDLRRKYERTCQGELQVVVVDSNLMTLEQAVETYLFNSQIVTAKDESRVMIAPANCQDNPSAKRTIEHILANSSVGNVHYVELGESLKNGGGPACLRLRVVLTPNQQSSIAGVTMTDQLYTRLKKWITDHYRERLSLDDLRDPNLPNESQTALAELSKILNLPNLYNFQK